MVFHTLSEYLIFFHQYHGTFVIIVTVHPFDDDRKLTALASEQSPAALTAVSQKLAQVASILMSGGIDRVLMTGDASTLSSMNRELPSFLAATKAKQSAILHPSSFNPSTADRNVFYSLPVGGNHVIIYHVPYLV
jgi:hypothetical protein